MSARPRTKALLMKPLERQLDQGDRDWDYMHNQVGYKDTVVDKTKTVKNSQFAQPLFEFSGACAGCGETPYIKTITQLFGDRMMVANATGCSSIYGGSAPSYALLHQRARVRVRHGPTRCSRTTPSSAWACTSAIEKLRERLIVLMKDAIQATAPAARTS